MPLTPSTAAALTSRLRRMGTQERISVRTSLPGPLLASPLSTSLSAMVADLKRGGSFRSAHHEHPGAARRGSVLALGPNLGPEDEDDGEGIGRIGEPLDRRRTHNDEARPAQGRGRSLSGTLGDLWRGLRRGSVNDEAERPEGLGRRESER